MSDRELLAMMAATLCANDWKDAAGAIVQARWILSEIDKSPAPEAGSDSASPSLTAVKRYENIDRAAKRVLSVFDVARSPHGAPSRAVEPDGATDALCALMDAVEGFAPPSRAETPTEADCAEAWYTAGTITCPEGMVRRTTTAGREITLSAQTWVRIAAVRALCLTSRPEGIDAETEKWRTAARVLCGAHVGVPQERCPVCERDELRKRQKLIDPAAIMRRLESVRAEQPNETPTHWLTVAMMEQGLPVQAHGVTMASVTLPHTKTAPPPVAREATSGVDEAVNDLRAAAFVTYHAVKSGQQVAPEVLEAIPKAIERIDAARASLPSGEAGVDGKNKDN